MFQTSQTQNHRQHNCHGWFSGNSRLSGLCLSAASAESGTHSSDNDEGAGAVEDSAQTKSINEVNVSAKVELFPTTCCWKLTNNYLFAVITFAKADLLYIGS